jgi:hypothetical protein
LQWSGHQHKNAQYGTRVQENKQSEKAVETCKGAKFQKEEG